MSASKSPGEQRRIDEFTGAGEQVHEPNGRCKAIAVSTSERCERDALAGVDYCAVHIPREKPDKRGL